MTRMWLLRGPGQPVGVHGSGGAAGPGPMSARRDRAKGENDSWERGGPRPAEPSYSSNASVCS